jgi:hypothetical protein
LGQIPSNIEPNYHLPTVLSPSYRRLTHDHLPTDRRHRIVAMVEYPDGMLTFHEGLMSRELLESAKEREIQGKIVLTGIQAARGKQGNDLIVHSERFFLCSHHV